MTSEPDSGSLWESIPKAGSFSKVHLNFCLVQTGLVEITEKQDFSQIFQQLLFSTRGLGIGVLVFLLLSSAQKEGIQMPVKSFPAVVSQFLFYPKWFILHPSL